MGEYLLKVKKPPIEILCFEICLNAYDTVGKFQKKELALEAANELFNEVKNEFEANNWKEVETIVLQ